VSHKVTLTPRQSKANFNIQGCATPQQLFS